MPATDRRVGLYLFLVCLLLARPAEGGQPSQCHKAPPRMLSGSGRGPSVWISAEPSAENIVVKVSITNLGSSRYRLLSWDLPFHGGMSGGLFDVYRGFEEIPYRGMAIKRKITKEDYINVDPGFTCSTSIPLAPAYDVTPPGQYRIQYRAANQHFHDGLDWLTSNEIEVERK